MRGFGPARRGEGMLAGFRPRTPRSFCFGKRTQNHGRPGGALRVPLPRSRRLGLRNSLRSDSPRPPTRFRDRGAATPAGALRWRHTLALSFFPRPLGEGRVRAILASSPGRMRHVPGFDPGCRHYLIRSVVREILPPFPQILRLRPAPGTPSVHRGTTALHSLRFRDRPSGLPGTSPIFSRTCRF